MFTTSMYTQGQSGWTSKLPPLHARSHTHTHTHSHTHTHWQVCKYTHNTTACKITRTHTRSLTHWQVCMYTHDNIWYISYIHQHMIYMYTRQHMIYIIHTEPKRINIWYIYTRQHMIYIILSEPKRINIWYIYTRQHMYIYIHIQTTYAYIYTRQHMYIYIYIHTTTYVCMIYIIHTGPKRLTKLLVSFVCDRMMWYVIGWCDMW